jgi:hypothetical protein
LESFFQLVEQQKLLWAFCHGSTTQAIKNLESFFQLVEQQKIPWTVSLRSTAETIQNAEDFLTTCGTTKNSLDSFSDQWQKQHKIWKAFYQLVEQQKLLWAFCHGSTTQTIKKLGKLFPTCETTKTSLGIFSQINSRNNTKCGRLFNNLSNTKNFFEHFLSDQQRKQ